MPAPAISWPAVTFGLRSLSRKAFAVLAWPTRPRVATAVASAIRLFFITPPNRWSLRASEGRAVPSVGSLRERMRQGTQRGTDSHVSCAWLTLQTDTAAGNQIWPHLWRIRHKIGRGWGQFPQQGKRNAGHA